MKVLVVGLGIGQVYVEQLNKLEVEYDTVDINPDLHPTYSCIEETMGKHYNLSIICTPNFLHKSMAEMLMECSDIVLVEKPGFKNAEEWKTVRDLFEENNKKLLLVKNNSFRDQLGGIEDIALENEIRKVYITWYNMNRIPNPGSWFTDKERSFGGVSKDLLPHLICFAFPFILNLDKVLVTNVNKEQKFDLSSLSKDDTEYGKVNLDGVYDVDDVCYCTLNNTEYNIYLDAAWKTDEHDIQNIQIFFEDGTKLTYDFGLCPNEVYGKMLKHYLHGYDMSLYKWEKKLDDFILKTLDKFEETY